MLITKLFGSKQERFLKKCVKRGYKIVKFFRYRYFWGDETEFKAFSERVLSRLLKQIKLHEEELDKIRGRS